MIANAGINGNAGFLVEDDALWQDHWEMNTDVNVYGSANTLRAVLPLMAEPAERVVTDGHTSYPRAIAEVLGESVRHAVSQSVHNPVEQSHRKLKHRYYPTIGFSNVETASYFCEAVEELNQLRVRRSMEVVSLLEHQHQIQARMKEFRVMLKTA